MWRELRCAAGGGGGAAADEQALLGPSHAAEMTRVAVLAVPFATLGYLAWTRSGPTRYLYITCAISVGMFDALRCTHICVACVCLVSVLCAFCVRFVCVCVKFWVRLHYTVE
jgi:hypothetical protein